VGDGPPAQLEVTVLPVKAFPRSVTSGIPELEVHVRPRSRSWGMTELLGSETLARFKNLDHGPAWLGPDEEGQVL